MGTSDQLYSFQSQGYPARFSRDYLAPGLIIAIV
jgi:hypothetical protein